MDTPDPKDKLEQTAAFEVPMLFRPFDERPDETLVVLMLEMKISDRLQSHCCYVRGLRRFHTV